LFCFALLVLPAIPVLAENLLDVIEAAQNSIETKYSNPESIARKLALEQLEKIARSGKPDDQIIRAILEAFPETSAEMSGKSDLNSNGIPDEWEKKRNVSARFTAPESDEDSDGFTLLQEYRADTDPLDPLSHPKYITQVYVSSVSRQRFPGLELLSVNRDGDKWYNKMKWIVTFNVVRNDRRRSELVGIDSGTFTNNDVTFSVVDIEEGDSGDVVYIRRVGRDERIPCRPRQPVYDPLPRVKFLNVLDGKTITGQVGETLKLGSKKTGEETYRIVSAAFDTKMTVVESVADKPETFKLPPAPGELPAAKTQAKTASAKASEKSASSAKKTED
jgi:hypothetical protein